MGWHAPGPRRAHPFDGGLLTHTASSRLRATTNQRAARGLGASPAWPNRARPRAAVGVRGVGRRGVDVASRPVGLASRGVGRAAPRRQVRAVGLRARARWAPVDGARDLARRKGCLASRAGAADERGRRDDPGRQRHRSGRARRPHPTAGRRSEPGRKRLEHRPVVGPYPVVDPRSFVAAHPVVPAHPSSCAFRRRHVPTLTIRGARPDRVTADPHRGARDTDVMPAEGLRRARSAAGSHPTDLGPQSTGRARSVNL